MTAKFFKARAQLAKFALPLLLAMGACTLSISTVSAQQLPPPASASERNVFVSPSILQALGDPRSGGLQARQSSAASSVRVIVNFAPQNTPQGRGANTDDIKVTRAALLDSLPPSGHTVVSTFDKLPMVSLEINREALDALLQSPDVSAITADNVVTLHMAQANVVTGVNTAHSLAPSGYTGAGVRAGIIDTGIDSDHPDLANDLIFQRCFRTENDCPNGNNVNSAEDTRGHGTHVAGIITGPLGVAPGAKFAALKVFTTGNTSDTNILAALNYVIAYNNNSNGILPPLELDFINMSLGSSNFSTQASCDNASRPYVDAFATLNAMGIAVFVSTGNDGSRTSVGSPGCATGAIGVGSTGDESFLRTSSCRDDAEADRISCFSNATPSQGPDRLVDLVAPGCRITSTGLLGSTNYMLCGTSMATPYALGVAALVREYANSHGLTLSPAAMEALLRSTGVPVSDYRMPVGSPTFPRVSPLDAIGALAVTSPTSFTITGTTSTSVSSSWGAVAGATQYRIYRATTGGGFVLAGSVTAPPTSFTDNTVPCDSQDYYVRAYDGQLESQPSNTASATARACPNAPAPLILTRTGPAALTLQWGDNNTDETAYRVERSVNGAAFQTLADLAANTTTTNESGLTCGQRYDYRVMAVRGTDQSTYTNTVVFLACPPANDEFATATVITTTANTYSNTVSFAQLATTVGSDPAHTCAVDGAIVGSHTLWWSYTPPLNGTISLDTLPSSGSYTDTIMSVFTGTLGSFTEVACNDDGSGTVRSQLTNVPVTAGTPYTVYISRYGNTPTAAVGSVALNLAYAPVPAVMVAPTSVNVAEGGGGASYSLVLSTQPSTNVTITVTPNNQITAPPATVTFTTTNWNTPQTVTVTAVNDAVVEGNHTGSISHSVSSSDAGYNGLVVSSVTANITDNDFLTFTVTGSALPTIGGSVSCVPTTVVQGSSATCTATANTGFTFSNWDGHCGGAGACVLANVTANRSVTANFAPVLSLTLPTANGTGTATFSIDAATGCRIEQAGFAPAPTPLPPQSSGFPHGLVNFTLGGCSPGATAQVTITFPQSVQGMQYWKRLANASWVSMPATLSGNTVSFSIQDNGAFDLDATPGVIRDPSGPGAVVVAPVPVPSLSQWALFLLAGLLFGAGVWQRRKYS